MHEWRTLKTSSREFYRKVEPSMNVRSWPSADNEMVTLIELDVTLTIKRSRALLTIDAKNVLGAWR